MTLVCKHHSVAQKLAVCGDGQDTARQTGTMICANGQRLALAVDKAVFCCWTCSGAASLTFQSMRELMERGGAPQPTKPEVAIAFVAPHNLKDVAALGPDISRTCQSLFTSVVREVLLAVGGYESKEVAGQVMAAFAGPRQAVEWALALQCALLQVCHEDYWPICSCWQVQRQPCLVADKNSLSCWHA